VIQRFVDAFMSAKPAIVADLAKAHPDDYTSLVKSVMEVLSGVPEDWPHSSPDPERITVIDHGHYQGTLLYIVADKGYQPDDYWSIFVDYGSCSGCDTLESIRNYDDTPPTEEQVGEYWTLMLHIVQSMKPLKKDEDEP
jgi:hypothetical protein